MEDAITSRKSENNSASAITDIKSRGQSDGEPSSNNDPCASSSSSISSDQTLGQELQNISLEDNPTNRQLLPYVPLIGNDSKTDTVDKTAISDAGRFALAAICSLSLHQLFGNKWDEDFRLRSIRYLITNLELPQRVQPIMFELVKGNVTQPYDSYINLLRSEQVFREEENFHSVVFNLVTLAVHDGKYDSRWRVLILYIAKLIGVDRRIVDSYERKLISCVLQKKNEPTQDEKNEAASRKFSAKTKRYALIGLATIGGGALIGVTGGIAAPLIGAGLSSFLGTSAVFTAIGTTAGAAIVGSLFGVAGGGLTGYKMRKRVGDIEEFEFHELKPKSSDEESFTNHNQQINVVKELHVTIVISGWIKNNTEENYVKPWSNLFNGREQYYLKYESSYLVELGKAMEYIFSFVATMATQNVLKLTVLSGLMTAITWPAGLLGLASVIDNPWGVCLRRSAQVGKQLAEVLLSRSQGHRPVTLLGYSLGARVIFYCLREMAERRNCEGIIQDVILIGAPCTAQADEWNKFRRVVAGRIVNGYCRGDWLLRFLYRTLSVAVDGVAGLQKIDLDDPKMNNVDLTDMVTGHGDYPEQMTAILCHIGVPVVI